MSKKQLFPSTKSLMSRPRILEEYGAGNIVIEPFVADNVGTNQYDVTLGPYYYRANGVLKNAPEVAGIPLYNPYSESDVRSLWRQYKAEHLVNVKEKLQWSQDLENISPDDRVIIIMPGETILGHTLEYIGGACNNVTTIMKARSTSGRNMITVCRDAGQGDVGYFTRWTMEISNNSRSHAYPLVVGRRIAQLVFFETDPVDDLYTKQGKYQTDDDLEVIKANWSPEDMLPKKWRDREVRSSK